MRADLGKFVGNNAHYYLRRWFSGGGTDPGNPGFNLAAFFLAGAWLGYRKMYRVACLFFGIIWIETLLEEIVFVEVLGLPETPQGIWQGVGIAAAVIVGSFGNRWYLSHARREVEKAHAEGLAGRALAARIRKRGGTSVFAGIAVPLVAFAVLLAALVGMDYALHPATYDPSISFYENDEVIMADGVGEADARILAQALETVGFFGGKGASVRLAREEEGHTVSFVLLRDAWNEAETVEGFRTLGEHLAEEVLENPLTVELCDDSFDVQKTLTIE